MDDLLLLALVPLLKTLTETNIRMQQYYATIKKRSFQTLLDGCHINVLEASV
ncbi:hypothetical protein IRB23SM22_11660 [Alkalibacterium sp. s-m-22]